MLNFAASRAHVRMNADARFRELLRLSSTHDLALACTDTDGLADGEPVGAHRSVLALASPVFRALLFGEMAKPMVDGVVTLPLPGKSRQAMRAFVDACYLGESSELGLEHDPELNLLQLADEYQLPELKGRIERELVTNLHAEAAVDMLLYARQYRCAKLKAAAAKFIVNRFEGVTQVESFARLPADALQVAMRDSELNVATEEDVFKALVRWHDGQAPGSVDAETLRALLSSLRYATMDPAFVETEVAKHAIFGGCDGGEAMRAAAVSLASSSPVGSEESSSGAPSSSGTPGCSGPPSSGCGSKRPRPADATPMRAPPPPSSLLLRTPAPIGLGGEFVTPSPMRSSVKLNRASRGGQTFRYEESDPDGYFAWLGTAAGSREWSNPAKNGQVSVVGIGGTGPAITDGHLLLAPLDADAVRPDALTIETSFWVHPAKQLTISVPHDLLLTGYAVTLRCGPTFKERASNWSLEGLADGSLNTLHTAAATHEMLDALDRVGHARGRSDRFIHGLGHFDVRPSRAYRQFQLRTGSSGGFLIARLELYGSIMSPEAETDEAPRKRARV